MPMSGMDVIHEGIEITAEREDIAKVIVVLRIFAVRIRKSQESQPVFVEGERAGHARQVIHAEVSENDA